MARMMLWSLDPPRQWRAGFIGTAPNQTAMHFDCADCGAKEPAIAGIISTDGTFTGIGIVPIPGSAFVHPAMFCAPCFAKRLNPPTTQPKTGPDRVGPETF